MKVYIPEGYKSILGMYDTQKAISLIHRLFEDRLGALLNLYRVSAPLFVEENSGLNDNLNGYERPVSFDILHAPDHKAQVVQSLAKWKRLALKRYGFFPGKGLYTDMNAIRRDEDELDNLHSVYVDQWDWEKVILPENRNTDYLKLTVMDIVSAICDTQDTIESIYPQLQVLGKLKRDVSFVTTQELEDLYPDLTPKQRENTWVKEHRTAFTDAPRTMTTGTSTGTSSSMTMFWTAPWRSLPWESAWIRSRWTASCVLPAATSAEHSRITECF